MAREFSLSTRIYGPNLYLSHQPRIPTTIGKKETGYCSDQDF